MKKIPIAETITICVFCILAIGSVDSGSQPSNSSSRGGVLAKTPRS